MKKEDVGMAIAVIAVIILFGYASYHGVQQSEMSFQEKCDETYGEGNWIRLCSQVLWANGEARYATELCWEVCVSVDIIEDRLNDWKEDKQGR